MGVIRKASDVIDKIFYEFEGNGFVRSVVSGFSFGRRIRNDELTVEQAAEFIRGLDETVDIEETQDKGFSYPLSHHKQGWTGPRIRTTKIEYPRRNHLKKELQMSEEEREEKGIVVTHQAYDVFNAFARVRAQGFRGLRKAPWRWEQHYIDIKQTRAVARVFRKPHKPSRRLEFLIDPKTRKGIGSQLHLKRYHEREDAMPQTQEFYERLK